MLFPELRDVISKSYLADEEVSVRERMLGAKLSPGEAEAARKLARGLVLKLREPGARRGGVDAFMHEYALSSEEGVALMCLAEALLRVPDAKTAARLIRDKIGGADWNRHKAKSDSMFVNASTWALMLTGRIVQVQDTHGWDFERILKALVARSGEPVIRQAVTFAMHLLGRQFVLGRTTEEALTEARAKIEQGYRFSFDMLGEAAYTKSDAAKYAASYAHAIEAIGTAFPADGQTIFARPSISVKLSALHPRYEWVQHERVMRELLPTLEQLAQSAKAREIGLTIDAEEAERLDLMLDVFEALSETKALVGWSGLGLAVQAYQKRVVPVLDWLHAVAQRQQRRIPVRLVKGAYWDSEIKRGQEAGTADYPVYTLKAGTDVSYLAAARRMLKSADVFYPQFATHNAHTMAALDSMAGPNTAFEFQRLHGMGELLHALYREARPGRTATRVYAPVGSHEDLLAYLVRRLLENGANTSFVNRLADNEAPLDDIIADPETQLTSGHFRNPRIPKPGELFFDRRNSRGFFLSDPAVATPLLLSMQSGLRGTQKAVPVISGEEQTGEARAVLDPADRRRVVGSVIEAGVQDAERALTCAAAAQPEWDRMGGKARADILDRASDLFERDDSLLMALCVREAGKTLPNALGEIREAVDFLRYYAANARRQFGDPLRLPSVTGEENELSLHGKGVFACISPWNFALSIFSGQVGAALASGNAVLAKPAEQTPLIAAAAVNLLHEAGVPKDVLHFLPGDGPKLGAAMFADTRLAGVAFTGSTEAAWAINRSLAAREGPIAALIAETGGQNVMIVDSTALPEQVSKDVLTSAFDSAGQRCSALRVLFVQDEVADRMLDMILGAMDELKLGDPFDLATDIGPVIDEEARENLQRHAERLTREAKLLRALAVPADCAQGVFFAPHVFAIPALSLLKREVFGPVLHVVRYAADRLSDVCDAINATGYGLTLGIHSRIEGTADFFRSRVRVGNLYVNRNQIGAVVGEQPFGGERLSGTGPKAGGPDYLLRFAVERTYTVNTAAAGGNVKLLSSA